jgi:hypothetical protein
MSPKDRIEERDYVRIDYRNVFGAGQEKNWVQGRVVDKLATQFTALIDDEEYGEQLVFRAYQDYGTTWETYDA